MNEWIEGGRERWTDGWMNRLKEGGRELWGMGGGLKDLLLFSIYK